MRIPLPGLMRRWRDIAHREKLNKAGTRRGLALWAWAAQRPKLYRAGARIALSVLRGLGGRRGSLRRAPLAGGWTASRDLPAPEGGTFVDQWQKSRRAKERK